jgi:hypothetical protein
VAGVWAVRHGVVETQVMPQLRLAAIVHKGNILTPGYTYKLLDERFYTSDEPSTFEDMTPTETARFVTRAAASFLLVPLPWDSAPSKPSLALMPQQLAWYVLAVLLPVGIAAGLRRDALFTWLLVGTIVVGAAAISLFNGNVGTLVRLRDSVVSLIVWLSATGGCATLEWLSGDFFRRSQHAHSR